MWKIYLIGAVQKCSITVLKVIRHLPFVIELL